MSKLSDNNDNNIDSSSPSEKAERVKRIRNLANLSREQFCNQGTVNPFTLKGWELGRHGGVSKAGASRIVDRVAKEGVVCSVEWIMTGAPPEPYIMPTSNSNSELTLSDEKILKEISLFQNMHQNAVFCEITDDALSPHLLPGDYVAGVKHVDDEIKNVLERNCIILTSDNKQVVRYLKQGTKAGFYNLISTNVNTQAPDAIYTDTKIKFAAPILRHYRKI